MTLVSTAPPHVSSARRRLGILLLAALVLRLLVIAATTELEPRIVDEEHYHQLASSLVEGRGFSFTSGPTSLRPPLYPALVAATWLVTSSTSLVPIRVVQALLAVLTAWLVFVAARDLYDERTGLVAAGIAAFYPSLVFANALLLTETLFTCLLMAVVVLVVRVIRRPHLGVAAAAGALIGLAALTRSVVWPLPLVLAPLLAWWTPGPVIRRLGVAVALAAGFAIVIGPWAVRNTQLQGVPVLVDTMGGLNLRMGNYEHTPHDRIWDAVAMHGSRSWVVGLPAHPPSGGAWTEGWKERWARDQALSYMRTHPGQTLWRSAIKFGDFWALDREFLAGVQDGRYRPPAALTVAFGAAQAVAFPGVLLLAVAAVFLRAPADWRLHAWLLLLVLFVCALHTIVFAHPRYRLPVMPVIAIYAAAALADGSWRRARDWPRAAMSVALALGFVTLWIVQFAWRDWPFVERLLARVTG